MPILNGQLPPVLNFDDGICCFVIFIIVINDFKVIAIHSAANELVHVVVIAIVNVVNLIVLHENFEVVIPFVF